MEQINYGIKKIPDNIFIYADVPPAVFERAHSGGVYPLDDLAREKLISLQTLPTGGTRVFLGLSEASSSNSVRQATTDLESTIGAIGRIEAEASDSQHDPLVRFNLPPRALAPGRYALQAIMQWPIGIKEADVSRQATDVARGIAKSVKYHLDLKEKGNAKATENLLRDNVGVNLGRRTHGSHFYSRLDGVGNLVTAPSYRPEFSNFALQSKELISPKQQVIYVAAAIAVAKAGLDS